MIVPRNRLLFWFAAVALPFSVLAATPAPAPAISVSLIGGLLLVALIDAVLARAALAGLRIELPPVVRMSLGREAKIELRIRNERQKPQVLRLALALPPEFESSHEELLVTLPAGSEWSRVTWPCRPLKRGSYRLECAYAEGGSPLGFWGMRGRLSFRSELRVYPNLQSERKKLGMLLLHRTLGIHSQQQVGRGREFEKLREYVAGDGSEDIHWKATARKGHPVTKVFRVERTQEIYVVVDASRLSARQDALERYLKAALAIGLAAEQQDDLFGVLVFSDRVEKFVRARGGRSHYTACRDAIHAFSAKLVNPDYDEVFSFIRLHLRRRALILFLTALDDPLLADQFVHNIDLVSRQHLLLVSMLQPQGAVPLFSDSHVSAIDDLYEHLGGHLRWHNLRELGKVLQRRGVNFSVLDHERLSVELVSQYLNVKRRQLL